MKNPAGAHLAAMRIRVRGRATVILTVGFVVAAATLAAVAGWHDTRTRAPAA